MQTVRNTHVVAGHLTRPAPAWGVVAGRLAAGAVGEECGEIWSGSPSRRVRALGGDARYLILTAEVSVALALALGTEFVDGRCWREEDALLKWSWTCVRGVHKHGLRLG